VGAFASVNQLRNGDVSPTGFPSPHAGATLSRRWSPFETRSSSRLHQSGSNCATSQLPFCFTNPALTVLAVSVGSPGGTVTLWFMNTSSDADSTVRDSIAAAGTVAVAVICLCLAPGITVSSMSLV
jgi:hypothetical protein